VGEAKVYDNEAPEREEKKKRTIGKRGGGNAGTGSERRSRWVGGDNPSDFIRIILT